MYRYATVRAKIQITTVVMRRVAHAVSGSNPRSVTVPRSVPRNSASTSRTTNRVARKITTTAKSPGRA